MVRSWHFKWGTTEGLVELGFLVSLLRKAEKKPQTFDGSYFYELDVW